MLYMFSKIINIYIYIYIYIYIGHWHQRITLLHIS